MAKLPRPLAILLLVAALAWHALAVLHDYKVAHRDQSARDFASYHYAVKVAAEGGDPYDRGALGAVARDEATRGGVHPFFYPPPYLLTMLWVLPLDLVTAYRVWFWLDELLALGAWLVLWRWWRPLGPTVGVTLALSLAALTALPNNHLMGQMNLPVLLLVFVALEREERGASWVAGAAMGLACMMKMSPGLLVAWWLLRGRNKAAFVSVGTAVLLTLASLPLAGPAVQARFYGEVLPGFGSGRYNGLGVGIDLFGNHSLPNLYDAAFPAGPGHLVLSDTARLLGQVTALGLVGGLGWALRAAPKDALARAGQVASVMVVMLLLPVFTYEHHLVWALPAVVVAVAALAAGRLGAAWAAPVGLACAAWAFDLASLKEMALYVQGTAAPLAWLLQEAKLFALLVLGVASVIVGRSAPGEAG